ncbi:MAG TPA: hypothetical protein VFF30_01460 [Nitrososphaerales archaeon]|nr:hypothetical protein [Nitrososphaerales archaeon]
MPALVEGGETYTFGLASPAIRKSRLDPRCLGVYVTSKRIFITYAPAWIQIMMFPALLVGIVVELFTVFGIITEYLMNSASIPVEGYFLEFIGLVFILAGILTAWHRNSTVVSIIDLEKKRKVYQIERAQVSKIEFKRREILTSYIVITPRTGEHISLIFVESGSFNRVRHSLETFSPLACRDL